MTRSIEILATSSANFYSITFHLEDGSTRLGSLMLTTSSPIWELAYYDVDYDILYSYYDSIEELVLQFHQGLYLTI